MKIRVKGNRNIVIDDINLSLFPNKAYFHIDDERWNSSNQKDFVLKYLDVLPDNVPEKKEEPIEINTEVGIRQVNSAFILDEENKEKDNHDSVMVNENGKIVDNLEKEINKDIFNGYVKETNTVEHDVKVVADVKADGDNIIGVTAEVPENKVENNEVTYIAAPGTETVEVAAEEEKEEKPFVEFPVVEEPIESVPTNISTEETSEDEEFEEVEEEVTETAEDDTVETSKKKKRRGRPRKNK